MVIENLFPTPVAFFKFEKQIDKTFLIDLPQRTNEHNTSSVDRYILKHSNFLELRHYIEKCAYEYFIATYNPKNDVHLKITQSWLNWTKPEQYHHKHAHPNSFISGCYYVNANKETDKIYFYQNEYRQIKFPPIEWNTYNSESWWFPVGSGDLVFFPSHLTHMVQPVCGEETRISLAFNMFPIGHIGDEDELTALYLQVKIMAHFAKLDDNNIVLEINVVDNNILNNLPFPESESVGVEFLTQWSGGYTNWKQTSYNSNFRKHYAGISYTYDASLDAFISPKPYPSWTLDDVTANWIAPVPCPTDGQSYEWNEATQTWVINEN